MSAPPVRRKDKLMTDQRAVEFLARSFCGRIASVGADGWPYCVPLLYVLAAGLEDNFIYFARSPSACAAAA